MKRNEKKILAKRVMATPLVSRSVYRAGDKKKHEPHPICSYLHELQPLSQWLRPRSVTSRFIRDFYTCSEFHTVCEKNNIPTHLAFYFFKVTAFQDNCDTLD